MPPQLSEAWDYSDDWTGTINASERRKRQNRLSQRAHRKRKHTQRMAAIQAAESAQRGFSATEMASSVDKARTVEASSSDLLAFRLIVCPKRRAKALDFVQRALVDYTLKVRVPSDLATLSRLNLLNALANNAVLLGICFDKMYDSECISPFNFHGPLPTEVSLREASVPGTLRPTIVQRDLVHHPWIDLIPIPSMRDNILLGIEVGRVDEEELCRDFADLSRAEEADGTIISVAPISVWGESYNVRNWELSAHFLEKWTSIIEGCPEVLEATNYWRVKRGEATIDASLRCTPCIGQG